MKKSNKQEFIIDLTRSKSSIYQAELKEKIYKAPFDLMLEKYLSNSCLLKVELVENNRILVFHTRAKRSYKIYTNKLYFEFTGKNTNAILTTEQDLVINALRLIDKSLRVVKVNQILEPLKAYKMDNNKDQILDFTAYFKQKAKLALDAKITLLKQTKLNIIEKKIDKLNSFLKALEDETSLQEKADNLAFQAELLLSNLYNLKPYERTFSLKSFDGKEIFYKLEKEPKQSVNLFYTQAKKYKQKAKNINLQRSNLKDKLAFLLNLKELVLKSCSEFELEILLNQKLQKKQSQEQDNIAVFFYNDFKISLGKNEKANELLLKNSKKDDLWLHLQNLPSPHVIISQNKQKLKQDVLEFASKLCVSFSNVARGFYLVDYTLRKFVKIKHKAFVTYTNFKSIKVKKD